MIASDVRLEDRTSNRLSLINIFEKVGAMMAQDGEQKDLPAAMSSEFKASLTSVWVIQDQDRGLLFENKIVFRDTSGAECFEMLLPPVKISSESGIIFHRINVDLVGLPPIPSKGIWWIVNKIRRIDATQEDWSSQAFPFMFEANENYFRATQQLTVAAASTPVSTSPEQVPNT